MKASDILLAACDVIEWQGWTQGMMQRYDERYPHGYKKGGAVCALGAIYCAEHGTDLVGHVVPTPASQYADKATLSENCMVGISYFNDIRASSKEEVIAKLIEAAQLAADEGN